MQPTWYEVLRFVRSHQRYSATPVIILTTRSDDIRATLLAEGASRYMTKPFQPQALLASARELLGLEPAVAQGRLERAALDELFRSFHSLKGLTAMVGLTDAERLAHQVESYLRLVREARPA